VDAARYLQVQGLAVAKGRGGRLVLHITQAGIDRVQHGDDVGAADDAGGADGKARGSAANFCGVLAGIGWAAVAALAAVSKQPMSNPWFILSLIVAVAATVFYLLAGAPDLLRWLRQGMRGLWSAVRRRPLSASDVDFLICAGKAYWLRSSTGPRGDSWLRVRRRGRRRVTSRGRRR
jgi:hypothetical protein